MQTHDNDLETAHPTRDAVERRDANRPDLAAKAMAEGNKAALSGPGVMHLQASVGNRSVARMLTDDEAPDKVHQVTNSGGDALDGDVRGRMEDRFGTDFGDVRVHKDASAGESARAVHAQAYTVGSHIAFDQGRYEPNSPAGERTLAHELTHVVQQRSGPVDGQPMGGGLHLSHPSDRYEQAAEQTADTLMSGGSAEPAGQSPVAAQRQEEEEEMGAGEIGVQRQGPEEEEEEAGAGEIGVQRQGGDEEEEEMGAGEIGVQRQGAEEEEEEAGAGQLAVAQRQEEAGDEEELAGG